MKVSFSTIHESEAENSFRLRVTGSTQSCIAQDTVGFIYCVTLDIKPHYFRDHPLREVSGEVLYMCGFVFAYLASGDFRNSWCLVHYY